MTEVKGLTTVGAPDHLVTHDSERMEHWITDDQLVKLAYGGKNLSFEIGLTAIGCAVGFLQNAWTVVCSIYSGTIVDPSQGFGAAIFVIAATVAALSLWSHKSIKKEIDDLVAKIRGRPTARVPTTTA